MPFFRSKKPTLREQADNDLMTLAFHLREEILSYQEADNLAAKPQLPVDTQLLVQQAQYDYIYRQIRRRKLKSRHISPDMFQ